MDEKEKTTPDTRSSARPSGPITPDTRPDLFDKHMFRVVLGAPIPSKSMMVNGSVEHPPILASRLLHLPIGGLWRNVKQFHAHIGPRGAPIIEQVGGKHVITPREAREIQRLMRERKAKAEAQIAQALVRKEQE